MTEPSFEQSQASMRPHEDPFSLPKILLISALVAPANPSRAICPAWAVAFAVLIAAALAERADRVYGRIHRERGARSCTIVALYRARGQARRTDVFVVVQACLFAFIYVLLDLEPYSLLVGALALFALVSALMAMTQSVNWSAQPSVSFN
jgi:Inner membrane protein CreD